MAKLTAAHRHQAMIHHRGRLGSLGQNVRLNRQITRTYTSTSSSDHDVGSSSSSDDSSDSDSDTERPKKELKKDTKSEKDSKTESQKDVSELPKDKKQKKDRLNLAKPGKLKKELREKRLKDQETRKDKAHDKDLDLESGMTSAIKDIAKEVGDEKTASDLLSKLKELQSVSESQKEAKGEDLNSMFDGITAKKKQQRRPWRREEPKDREGAERKLSREEQLRILDVDMEQKQPKRVQRRRPGPREEPRAREGDERKLSREEQLRILDVEQRQQEWVQRRRPGRKGEPREGVEQNMSREEQLEHLDIEEFDTGKPRYGTRREDVPTLFGTKERLDIFDAADTTEITTTPSLFDVIQKEELEKFSRLPPSNAFEEQVEWKKKGIVWDFPVNNEFGMEHEQNVGFHEHVFLEHLLVDGFPSKGPIRHFMELVCVGLSKNPYLTVQQKHDHISWFRDYFKSKQRVLDEMMVTEDSTSSEQKQIES